MVMKRNLTTFAISTNNVNCFVRPRNSWTVNGTNDTIRMKRCAVSAAIGVGNEFAHFLRPGTELSSQAHALQSSSQYQTIASIPAGLLSRVFPVVFGALSYLVTSLTNLVLPIASRIQSLGETMLTACLLLSIIQASIALYQYRYDARGQLAFPDGLTIGVEEYHKDCTDEGTREHGDERSNKNETTSEIDDILSEINEEPSKTMPQLMKKMNKALVLLLPWVTRNVHMLLTRNSHLFHIGFIITLASFLEDVMQNDSGDLDEYNSPTLFEKVIDDNANKADPLRVLVIGDSLSIGIGCIERFDPNKDNSMPMGLVQTTKLADHHQAVSKLQGPVFPQEFAKKLSQHFSLPVHWRSAGVDGGDINDIRRFCMDVLKEESSCSSSISNHNHNGKYVSGKPDLVVVLFGINDLKHLLGDSILHPFNGSSNEGSDGGIIGKFRHGIDSLLNEIHIYAPNAIVLFPAMPVQSYHKNSVVNIFPLGMMWDAILGFFLKQKKEVANKRVNCLHLDLTKDEIKQWYTMSNEADKVFLGQSISSVQNVLLSADGVHPNKRMYKLWAESVCQSFCDCVAPQIEMEQAKKHG